LYLFLLISLVILYIKNFNIAIKIPLVVFLSFLLQLTRPEFIFVIICTFIIHLLIQKEKDSNLFYFYLSISIGLIFVILAKILMDFNFFPNTVLAKQGSFDIETFLLQSKRGIFYIGKIFLWYAPISSLIGLTVFLATLKKFFSSRARFSKLESLILSLSISIVLFAVFSGGDWMEAGRFISAPLTLIFILFIKLYESSIYKRARHILVIGFLFIDFLITASYGFGGNQFFYSHKYEPKNFSPSIMEKYNRIHSRDISFIDKIIPYLRDSDKKIVIGSIQAGMVPYYLKKELGNNYYFVDLAGLSTSHIHKCMKDDRFWSKKHLEFDPYQDIKALQDCIGIKFDYISELGGNNWRRLELVKSIGCEEILRDEVTIRKEYPLKRIRSTKQFLAKCKTTD